LIPHFAGVPYHEEKSRSVFADLGGLKIQKGSYFCNYLVREEEMPIFLLRAGTKRRISSSLSALIWGTTYSATSFAPQFPPHLFSLESFLL
jgi:hypothetical protein